MNKTKLQQEPEVILPPQDLEAEQAALGAVLVEPGAVAIAMGVLEEADFYPEAHRLIFRSMRAVFQRNEPVDLVTVGAELRRLEQLDRVGGAEYLTLGLIDTVPTAAHVGRYCTLVAEKSMLRAIIRKTADIQEACYANPAGEDIPALVERLLGVAQGFSERLRPTDEDEEDQTLADHGATGHATTWLWDRWIPRGHLTVLGGDTGLGKSITALYLAAATTGQAAWPDKSDPPAAGKVYWVDSEFRQFSAFERMTAWGLDPSLIILPGKDGCGAGALDLNVPGTAEQIARRAERNNCGLVVVDSLSAAHGGDENASSLRILLKEAAAAAGGHNLAFLMVHHANKRGPLQGPEMTLDRLRGSGAIKQLGVSVLGLDQVVEGKEQPRRLHSLKLNFGRPPADLGFRFEGDSSYPFWGGAPEKPLVLSVEDQAGRFLLGELKAGPRLAAEVWDASRAAGLGERGVKAAKRTLGVLSYQQGGAGMWWWRLP